MPGYVPSGNENVLELMLFTRFLYRNEKSSDLSWIQVMLFLNGNEDRKIKIRFSEKWQEKKKYI